LNIPRKVNIDDLELSSKQLDTISGGIFGIDDAAIITVLALGAAGCGWCDG